MAGSLAGCARSHRKEQNASTPVHLKLVARINGSGVHLVFPFRFSANVVVLVKSSERRQKETA